MKSKKQVRRWRWVSREKHIDYVNYVDVWPGITKPVHYLNPNLFMQKLSCVSICISLKEFKKLFGFVPKKGKCFKVEFRARRVK